MNRKRASVAMENVAFVAIVSSLCALAPWDQSRAACSWTTDLGHTDNIAASGSDQIRAMRYWPDATYSDDLVIAGDFSDLGTEVDADGIAMWDGEDVIPMGGGIDVSATGDRVQCLAVFSNGIPSLYAGGKFTSADGISVSNIARWRWNGSGYEWKAVGMAGDGPNGAVHAMAVYDDGSGPALYVGGEFTEVPQVLFANTAYLAKWDGLSWSTYGGSTLDGTVRALEVYNDGNGEKLYIGGDFTNHVKTWDGTSTSTIASAPNDNVHCFAIHDDGTGYGLYVGGEFTGPVKNAHRIARYDGTWSALDAGFTNTVRAMRTHDDDLIIGGDFTSTSPNVTMKYITRWDGSDLVSMDSGFDSGPVYAVASNNCRLLAGGELTHGSSGAENLAHWASNDVGWTPLLSDLGNQVSVIAAYDGEEVVAGFFDQLGTTATLGNIATWDGTNWSRLAFGLGGQVNDVAVDGQDLYACGNFTTAINNGFGGPQSITAKGVAHWDGFQWDDLDTGLDVGGVSFSNVVSDVAVGGGKVYAGGEFEADAHGNTLMNLAYFENGAWNSVAGGVPNVSALAFYDGDLYVGGGFTEVFDELGGSVAANGIAKYDPSTNTWSSDLGTGLGTGGICRALYVDGNDLIIGGTFVAADGVSAANIVKWDGTNFTALGSGLPGNVETVRRADGDLYAGGTFDNGTLVRFAAWNGTSWSGQGVDCSPNGNVKAIGDPGDGVAVAGTFPGVGTDCSLISARGFAVFEELQTIQSPPANEDLFTNRGRGVKALSSGGESSRSQLAEASLRVAPNPAGARVQLSVVAPESGRALLEIYDAAGRLRTTVLEQEISAGTYTVDLDTHTLVGKARQGVFFARFTMNGKSQMHKVVVLDH